MNKTFRNLVFKPHPSNPKYGIQAKLDLKEGYVISVVAGRHFYSTINDKAADIEYPDSNSFVSFEVGIIDPDGGIKVQGWQNRDQINRIINNERLWV